MPSIPEFGSLQPLYDEWKSYCDDILAISTPIFEELNITVVRYSRTDKNNQKLTLVNNQYWLEQYFKEKFYINELIRFEDYQSHDSGISLHGPCLSNHPSCAFWNKHSKACDYKYILCMYDRYESYLEVFDFAIKEDDHAGGNNLINNVNLLKHFKIYFKSKTKSILKKASKLSIPPLDDNLARENFLLGLDRESTKRLINNMPVHEIFLDGIYDGIKITLAEAKCLKLHMQGFKYKEIGKKIGISYRTVESHIYNTRQKFGISDRDAFMKAIHYHGIFEKLEMIKI